MKYRVALLWQKSKLSQNETVNKVDTKKSYKLHVSICTENKMLTFILKKKWYDKIKNGEKTIEYREVKPYWDRRICKYKNWYSQFIAPKNRANYGLVVQINI